MDFGEKLSIFLQEKCNIEIEYRNPINGDFPIRLEIVSKIPEYSHNGKMYISVNVLKHLEESSLKRSYVEKIIKTIALELGNIYNVKTEKSSLEILGIKNEEMNC